MFGFLNVNKQTGMTSHKVVSILRKITGEKQIGHCGTLDPLAEGVLPIAIGKASKLIDYLPTKKRYVVGLEFGKRSDTYDIEGEIEELNCDLVTEKQIKSVLPKFRGLIKQVPPAYSAVHYKGKRLYELARAGIVPDDIPVREINIYQNEIVRFDEKKQQLELDITCSKGTYIRSIVNDIGIALNSGAIMYKLTRMESAGMKLENSLIIDDGVNKELIENRLINPEKLLNMEVIQVTEREYESIINGNRIANKTDKEENIESYSVLLKYSNRIVAIGENLGMEIQPKKLLI